MVYQLPRFRYGIALTARFILSLDCEGKWGVADHLTPANHAQLTDAKLREAYRSILDLLDRYAIPATFAYVGCFSLSAVELAQRRAAQDAKGWQPAEPRKRQISTALKVYAQFAASADKGAVRVLPE